MGSSLHVDFTDIRRLYISIVDGKEKVESE